MNQFACACVVVVLTASCEAAVSPSEPKTTASSRQAKTASTATTGAASVAKTHVFSDNFGGGAGCAPRGAEMTLRGRVEVRPFGKGTDGAVLKTADAEWVVSYRAQGPLLTLHGRQVIASGRACDKQGEAVSGKHFDLMSLTDAMPGSPGLWPPAGWWVVLENHGTENMRDAAFRFTDIGYTLVATGVGGANRSDRRTCDWQTDGVHWDCMGALPFSLRRAGTQLRLSFTGDAGYLVLVPATADRVVGLEKAAANVRQPKSVCDRAETCCIETFELLGATCDVQDELGGKQSARICQKSLEGLRVILTEKKLAFPASCRDD
jgi:hypothetical protein